MEHKNYKITFRMDENDYNKIKEISKSHGLNISEFSRFCVNSVIEGDCLPKAKVMYLVHKMMTDSELQKNKKVVARIKELMEECL